jgi:catechol 2,3-dioxygenase-like lactoylglutathione lyase family enzyme
MLINDFLPTAHATLIDAHQAKRYPMKFVNPLPFVADIGLSKRFYVEILGLKIVEDNGSFIKFDSGFALHDGRSLHRTVFGRESGNVDAYGRLNLVLYFEAEDLDGEFSRIVNRIELIHPLERQAWGQRVFRFYDPDHHIVEVGEPV